MLKFTIVTLFQEALEPYLKTSMMWKAAEKGFAEYNFVNLREFGLGPHRSVDDTPYGGGDGMLLRCEPVFSAIESVKAKDPSARVILPTPGGELWTEEKAREFAGVETRQIIDADSKVPTLKNVLIRGKHEESSGDSLAGSKAARNLGAISADFSTPESLSPDLPTAPTINRHFIILCPHYEGYDERILTLVDHQISLGRYVLTGGELPALIIIDSVVRLIPGVLGGETSSAVESFSSGDNLEYPQYTKPYDFRGMKVPEILLSGNHAEIAKWRAEHSRKFEG